MSRIDRAFQKGKAFIPFITAGDPSLEITEQLVYSMAEAGAAIIELGVPFSDPIAEGPIIQAADDRALAAGMTTDKLFDMIARIRRTCDVPIALMTYVNPVFTYGTKRFMEQCHIAGVDAIIVPDVPFEERDELLPYCKQYGITLISMLAPTSGVRIREIVSEAEGFLYCVSSLGVTGERKLIGTEALDIIEQVKGISSIPCAVGFGVSTPEQAKELVKYADGIIVGSAIVKLIAEHGKESVPVVMEYVKSIIDAIN